MAKEWKTKDLKNRKQIGDIEKRILFLNNKHKSKVFNFCCSSGGEGVSTVVTNLVAYLASKRATKDILVIDANFQRPVLDRVFGAAASGGLAEVLTGTADWSDALTTVQGSEVHFMSCGENSQYISGSLEPEKMNELLAKVRENYDYILMDSSPILTSDESLTVSSSADATFMVIQSMKTTKEVAGRTKSLLVDNECTIAGVILNRMKQVIPGWMYRLL